MNRAKILPVAGFALVICLILGYILFRFLPLIIGPEIAVTYPDSYLVTSESFIDITLETKRVSNLTIQGLPIDVQKSGTTIYRYQLSEGINRIHIFGADTYGSSKKSSILVIKKSGKPLK